MFDATQQDVSCGGGVGWGGYDDVHLHLHTWSMLHLMELANKQTLVSPIHLLSYAQTFVFKVLRDGLPRCILYTCPNL